jgi:hypothetical protein
MSGKIPYAQPYAWDSPSIEESQQAAIRSLRKRKFVGSGIAVLRKDSKSMGKVAQNILSNLFHQHGIEVPDAEDSRSDANRFLRQLIRDADGAIPKEGSSDEEILRNAGEGKYSLFLSLVKAVDTANYPVPTMLLVKTNCLVLSPRSVPGNCDSRDMILAALHFLSSKHPTQSDELLQLPVIRPIQAYGDLEKRNFEKAGNWKFDEIKEKLLKMEEIFLNSPSNWKWLKRETFCPRLPSKEEENTFFLTGSVPDSANPRKPKAEGSRKRKVTSPASSSIRQAKAPTSAIIAEASIDDTATSGDDDEIVVEATIVED